MEPRSAADAVARAVDEASPSSGPGRLGFLVGALFNGLLIWVAHNLLDWGFPPFLTDSFTDALPAVTVSLVVAVVANGLRIIYPARWFVTATEIPVVTANLYASVVMWRVFPFDFSDYQFRWDLVMRAFLIIAIVGTAIGFVGQVVKLLRGGQNL